MSLPFIITALAGAAVGIVLGHFWRAIVRLMILGACALSTSAIFITAVSFRLAPDDKLFRILYCTVGWVVCFVVASVIALSHDDGLRRRCVQKTLGKFRAFIAKFK
jgi:hypothetical protein